jgi:predicted DNA-binding protein (UPF0278 family)
MKRDKALQGWANRLKVIRAAVRLKYSLMADNELNEIIEAEAKKYFKSVQQGQLPAAPDVDKTVGR